MLRLKFFLGTMLLAVLAVGVSSFTVKDYKSNAFAQVCYYDNGAGGYTTAPNPPTPTSGLCNGGLIRCGFCVDDSHFDAPGFPKDYLQRAIDEFGNGNAGEQIITENQYQTVVGHPHPGFTINFYKKAS